eukprot:1711807-Rhodomonas_salina.2
MTVLALAALTPWHCPTRLYRPTLCAYFSRDTVRAYAATRFEVLTERMLMHLCYAMRGTELAYRARRTEGRPRRHARL